MENFKIALYLYRKYNYKSAEFFEDVCPETAEYYRMKDKILTVLLLAIIAFGGTLLSSYNPYFANSTTAFLILRYVLLLIGTIGVVLLVIFLISKKLPSDASKIDLTIKKPRLNS